MTKSLLLAISGFILHLGLGWPSEGVQDEQASQHDVATLRTSYVTEQEDLCVVTRYRTKSNKPCFATGKTDHVDDSVSDNHPRPSERDETIWVRYHEDHMAGHADLEKPVRCMLLHVQTEKITYGVYGLGGEKADLRMPHPDNERTVVWKGVDARNALIRLLDGEGFTVERAEEVVAAHEEIWLSEGFRAFLIKPSAQNESPVITVEIFEFIDAE